jgi:serine/threonine-protein kinase HipA
MSKPEAWVWIDLGSPELVGRLWTLRSRGRESATFTYEPSWLAASHRFALEPALQVAPGRFHTQAGHALFGSLGDSAPDRWGRTLIARAERVAAAAEGRSIRSLAEIDYLLGVSDLLRQGALRFTRTADGPFLATGREASIPPLVALPALLGASRRVLQDEESDADLALLLAPGSSLGGARPKAAVRDGADLALAKFPAPNDDRDVVRWEWVALELARRAGLAVPPARVVEVDGLPVLVIRRFDRRGATRVPFLSAMTLLGASDREPRSYLEIADAIRQVGAAPRADLVELWTRLAFNILVSNTDDHLRNHGFLLAGTDGWRLAPAFDLNPVPTDVRPRFLSTAVAPGGDSAASLALALPVAPAFGIPAGDAHRILRHLSVVVAGWRALAIGAGLRAREIERMASAFEHDDQRLAGAR